MYHIHHLLNCCKHTSLYAVCHCGAHFSCLFSLLSFLFSLFSFSFLFQVPRTLFLQFIDRALCEGNPTTFFEDEYRCPVYVDDIKVRCKLLPYCSLTTA